MKKVKPLILIVGVVIILALAGSVFFKYQSSRTVDDDLEEILERNRLAQEQREAEEAIVEPVIEVEEEPEEEPEEEVEEVEEEPEEEIPEFEEVTSISYGYKIYEYEHSDPEYTVVIVGSKLRAHFDQKMVKDTILFDTVYTDSKKSIAVGYCEKTDCRDPDIGVELFFPDVDYITPFYWIDQVKGVSFAEGGFVMKKYTWLQQKGDVIVWREKIYGLPIKAIDADGLEYYYEYYATNDDSLSADPPLGYEA